MTARKSPVVEFAVRPPPGELRTTLDTLRSVLGRLTSLTDVALVLSTAGLVTGAAAGAPGTVVTNVSAGCDFADAGIDQVRLVVYAKNSGAGSVTLAVYDPTAAKTLCTIIVTGTGAAVYFGDWTTIIPTGTDQPLELRVVGAGETPTLYAVRMQGRTLQARP